MKISETCIRRPVLSWVFSLVLVIIGLAGYFLIQVREFPDIDIPVVTVQTVFPGAAPDVVETEVVDILEEEINTIEGIRNITSQSREQVGVIIVEFELERDIDVATQDVRDAVARVRRRLPDDINEPVVQKVDLEGQAIMWLGMSSTWMNRIQLSDYADRFVKERLQVLPGVGRIQIGGQQQFAVRIDVDPAELAARGLTVADVAGALRREDVELPSGRLEGRNREIVVRTQGRFPSPEAFADLIVAQPEGTPVRLSDIATVRRGVANERSLARFMGNPSAGLGVYKQSQANTLDVANAVKAEVERLREDLPPGVSIEVSFDTSRIIQESVDSTVNTLILAAFLVVVVMFVFLHSLRNSLIPAIVIPVAILATFGFMYLLNFSINLITLLALILSIGLLVDDAIIMLENIFRHMDELGEDAMTAARTGSREIGFAIIASSLSLVSIFLPVAFITGIIGEFLYEFGLTVAIAIFLSTFIALTLTPMLCSRMLRIPKKRIAISEKIEKGLGWIASLYSDSLRIALRLRWVVVLLGLGFFALSFFFLARISTEFQPAQDQGSIIVIARGPEGSSREYTDRYLREIEAIAAATSEVRTYFAAIGLGVGQPNRAIMFLTLTDRKQRERDQFQIMSEIRSKVQDIPGLLVFLQERSPFGGAAGQSKPLQFVVQHPDLSTLATLSEELRQQLREIDGLTDVDSDLEFNRPELEVTIDRALAAELGVSARDIAEALQILIGGMDVSRYQEAGRQYDVIVRLQDIDRRRPQDLDKIHLATADGALVPLTNLVRFEEMVGPTQINHYNRQRSVTISANLDGFALGDAIAATRAIALDHLPTDASGTFAGEAADLEEVMRAFLFAFLLAVAVIYLVLAAQFESWVHPFTIMMGLPLALTGAFGALWLVGQTLNIFSIIGLILLIGLVTKNGILLIDYANQQRAKGVERNRAVAEAGRVRFRPILMTASTTAMAVLPIALGLGAGAEARAPLGTVVIGGLVVSTFLTLVIVPVVYTLLDDLRIFLRNLAQRRTTAP